MIEGFTEQRLRLSDEVTVRLAMAGQGPPILLLHGYPQTHLCWHKVAPELVRQGYTVVAPDLRGYGGSSKPESGPDHIGYAKRRMADDQVALMRQLGFDRFDLVGHDRGGRGWSGRRYVRTYRAGNAARGGVSQHRGLRSSARRGIT